MDRETVVESAARALFVSTFADICDDEDAPADFDDRDQKAGAGEDWMDCVSEPTPQPCWARAEEIVEAYERDNGVSIESAPSFGLDSDKFGHYLAMESMGHGVGLFEYAPKGQRPKVAYREFSAYEWMDSREAR